MFSAEIWTFIPVVSEIMEEWCFPLVAKVSAAVCRKMFVEQMQSNFLDLRKVAWKWEEGLSPDWEG